MHWHPAQLCTPGVRDCSSLSAPVQWLVVLLLSLLVAERYYVLFYRLLSPGAAEGWPCHADQGQLCPCLSHQVHLGQEQQAIVVQPVFGFGS